MPPMFEATAFAMRVFLIVGSVVYDLYDARQAPSKRVKDASKWGMQVETFC
jgi:hypothetical protein